MKNLNLKTLSLIVIASIYLSIGIAHADSVWYDTFDDKELDGWETELLDWDLSDAFTGESAEFDVSNGTWSFDVNIVNTPDEHFYVFLMTDDWADYPGKAYSYDLIFITEAGDLEPDSQGGVVLFKRPGWRSKWDTIGEWSSTEEITGWHHIDVTRDPDGVFDVYLDDELIIHVEDEAPEFDVFSTFRFEASSGPEIDNVVVLDTYDIETAREYEIEPEPEPEPETKPGGIPGFTIESVILGLTVGAIILWMIQRRA